MNLQEIINLDKKHHINSYGDRQQVCFSHGEGVKLWDMDNKEYIDFLSGISVNSIGHSHPNFVKAIKEQSEKYIHCSNLYYIDKQAQLSKKLSEISCFDKFFFGNSGAEANEAAIKLAKFYFKKKGASHRHEIITLTNSFHGRTLATITATGQDKFHTNLHPLPPGFIHIPINDYDKLDNTIADTTCAIMVEPIQGEGGINIIDTDYLKYIRDLCTDNNILLIFDEVQTGIGRTGKMFCYEHFEIEPDIMTLAKGIGGGFPIGALCVKDEFADAISPGDHGSTFGGNPLACTAALSVIETIERENLIENTANLSHYFFEKMKVLKNKYSILKEVRGKGLLIGIEFNETIAIDVKNKLFEKGYLVGNIGDKIIRIAPPLIITKEFIDKFLIILYRLLNEF
jgi:acetylornithine aminotransferase/acetylornithine/N-succinyldiaminopimelate aminotransferase